MARQYTGTAGRMENCQVGVFLAYAGPDGARALIDRELYLPEKWTGDRDRCRVAGIGDEVAFATKPALAQKMIGRAVSAGVPFCWVAADEVYGQNPGLRDWLEDQRIAYVMAVPCSEMITVAAGRRRADALAALVPGRAWQRLSCADGSKGPRLYDWALIETASSGHFLLVRRSLHLNEKGERELAYFWCCTPHGASLAELVAVAGARWAVEDCFAEAKNEAGLDHYQVRLYQAWYRHVTLSMLAHAFLAVTACVMRPAPPEPPPVGADDGEPAKRGSRNLWTAIQPAEDIWRHTTHPSRCCCWPITRGSADASTQANGAGPARAFHDGIRPVTKPTEHSGRLRRQRHQRGSRRIPRHRRTDGCL